jgi:hypothetical protein
MEFRCVTLISYLCRAGLIFYVSELFSAMLNLSGRLVLFVKRWYETAYVLFVDRNACFFSKRLAVKVL